MPKKGTGTEIFKWDRERSKNREMNMTKIETDPRKGTWTDRQREEHDGRDEQGQKRNWDREETRKKKGTETER